MQYLLDTNTCIAAMKNHPSVIARISAVVPSDCAVSTVTVYELYTGVEKCADPSREQSKVTRLLRTIREVTFDARAAREAAAIRARLEALGQMIGPYDVLLAGQAKAAGLRLGISVGRRHDSTRRAVRRLTLHPNRRRCHPRSRRQRIPDNQAAHP